MSLVCFGYFVSSKTLLRGRPTCVSLGLVVDTIQQCFLVGSVEHGYKKRDAFVSLGESILESVRATGGVSWLSAASFAGRAMAFALAIPVIRWFLNRQYGAICGRPVRWGNSAASAALVFATSHRRGDTLLLATGDVRAGYLREIEACMRLVNEDRVYPFIHERHACIVQLETDATLSAFGGYLELTPDALAAGRHAPWGPDHSYAFGQLLPDEVFGFHLGGSNSGITEMTGLWLTLAAIASQPHLLALFRNKFVRIGLDNQEAVTAYNSGAVSGEGCLVKAELVVAVLHFMWDWNCIFQFRHVKGIHNRADAPSRDRVYHGTRLRRDLFCQLWEKVPCEVHFTRDACSSLAAAMCPPGWEHFPVPERYLSYYSHVPDMHSAGVDVFAQDVAHRSDGTEEFCYVNPPQSMARAMVTHFYEARARALFLLTPPPPPTPWWWSALIPTHCQWEWRLPDDNSEYRCDIAGWRAVTRRVPLTAYLLDFRGAGSGRYPEAH